MTIRIRPPRSEDKRENQKWREEICKVVNKKETATQADSTAASVSDLKDDFNALLAKLQAANLMET
jgi:hypothetical protein